MSKPHQRPVDICFGPRNHLSIFQLLCCFYSLSLSLSLHWQTITHCIFSAAIHFPDPSMAEAEASKLQSLAEHYLVEEKGQKIEVAAKPVEEVKSTSETTAGEIVEKIEETLTHGASEVVAPAEDEESKESSPADDETADNAENDSAEPENSDNQELEEETPEIKIETAPADFRFPTTNQSRHCFTRYIEYHRCVAAKGDGAPECDKFAKYYRSLCPGEWVDRWNEQRENGTFPGPL
ncbi:hypothetical protein CASFOL_034550 [Castilleja foliolosa]|uniref:Cytochrome c oxidase subunit 6b-1 n=1 Tax=Castilleja foliolosa TaxID=1961234 RepID=A0ABD3BQY1_9LAMI